MKKQVSILFFLLSIANLIHAQFSISGEYRVRGEANNGFRYLPTEESIPAYYVSQRTRLNLRYNNEKYEAYFSLQDVRAWGQADYMIKSGIQYNSQSLDIHEAWFDWKFARKWSLKTGRQVWAYDDRRILAPRNWNQYGLAWDAFLLKFENEKIQFHFGSSINNTWLSFDRSGFNPEENPNETPLGYRIKYFNFLWFNVKFNNQLKLSLANYYASFLAAETQSVYHTLGTSGIHLNYHSKNLEALANLFMQYGKSPTGDKALAYMATLKAKFKFGSFAFLAHGDYLSGNDTDKDSYNAFNILYGARFPVYGWMNYWVLPADTKHGGLIDLYPGIQYSIHKKHQFLAHYHFFNLATKTFDKPELNKNLGNEFDINYIFKYDKDLTLGLYFSYYFASETTEYLKGLETGQSSSPYWMNIMLTFKPTFFTSKN